MELNNPLDLVSVKVLGVGLAVQYHTDPDDMLSDRFFTVKISYAIGQWSHTWIWRGPF